jgi:hypothetical protein
MTSTESRADRFTRELSELKIPDPSSGRSSLWLRLGLTMMLAGPVIGIIAYFMSHNTSNPLVQRDAIILAILGVSVGIAGAAIYLRYSLTGFLRFWMARQSFEFAAISDRIEKGDRS